MSRLVRALLTVAALLAAAWVAIELVGYPTPPARPAAVDGGAFRLENDKQHVVVLWGSPYALGWHNAHLFPDLMKKQEDSLLDALFTFARSPARAMLVRHVGLLYLAGLDRYLSPAEREEILGLAEGGPDPFPELGPRYARIASYHALHELSQRFAFDNPLFACTIVAVGGPRANGHALLGRNFDFEGGDVFDADKVVLAVRPDHGFGFVSVAWAGMAGVVSGMNERGLAVTINAGASSDYNRVGAPTTLLVRRALEQAATIDEAVAVLTAAPRFVTDVIGLAERSGRVAVLELTPTRHALREGVVLGATNHLESAALAGDRVNVERQDQTTTVPRRRRLEALLQGFTGSFAPADLLAILRDKRAADGSPLPLGHRHALDAFIATHSVIFDATAGVVWASEGPQASGPYRGYDVARLIAARSPADALAARVDDLPADADLGRGAVIARARGAWSSAHAALRRHDLAGAERALAEVPDLAGGHPTTLILSGDLAAAEGDTERARTYWRRALAIPPEYAAERRALEAKLAEPRRTP